MLSLPLVAPRDSHELWFGSYRSPSGININNNNNGADPASRRQIHNGPNNPHSHTHSHNGVQQQQYTPSTRALLSSATPSDSLALLQLEERALRLRKENIASFGCAWIKPAGCPKTMLGMREEEAEREEGLAAATQELNVAAMVAAAGAIAGDTMDAFGDPSLQQPQMGMGDGDTRDGGGGEGDGIDADELERDLDDDIPEADDGYGDDDDDDEEGLVEEGEEGYEEDGDGDVDVDEELMERDLDDDIPEGFPEDDGDGGDEEDDDEDEFEEEEEHNDGLRRGIMIRDLDEDIPEADDMEDEDMNEVRDEGEWQHTDSDDDADDDDDNTHDPYAEHIRGEVVDVGVTANTQTPGSANTNAAASGRRRRQQQQQQYQQYSSRRRQQPTLPPPPSTSTRRTRETEAQRRFLQRWSGGGIESDADVFDTSAITMDDEDDDDLRASIMGRAHSGRPRQSQGRFSRFMRRGGPRDSLD